VSDLFGLQQRISDLERRVAMLEGAPLPPVPDADPEVLQHIRSGNLIHAIKRYRELTGADLATAKQAVESIAART
jgi:ribosomal protein L7/L12